MIRPRATLAAFILQNPENPIALAETGMQRVQEGDVRTGIALLQSAIEVSGDHLNERVYAAIGGVGELLTLAQHYLPGRAHLALQVGLSGGKDERALQVLMGVDNMPTVPVLLKDSPFYLEPPAGAAWSDEFREATDLAARGWWRAAAARWDKQATDAADSPALWRNLAIVRGNLADYEGAVTALRKYTAFAENGAVSLDDAVEAEAVAQLLDREKAEGVVDAVLVTFKVNDMDELDRRLASDKQVDRVDIDPRALAEGEEPPPLAVYWLLDRPVVNGGPELPGDQVPQILGQLMIFGKQTDRDARVELDLHRPQLPVGARCLRELRATPWAPSKTSR